MGISPEIFPVILNNNPQIFSLSVDMCSYFIAVHAASHVQYNPQHSFFSV